MVETGIIESHFTLSLNSPNIDYNMFMNLITMQGYATHSILIFRVVQVSRGCDTS